MTSRSSLDVGEEGVRVAEEKKTTKRYRFIGEHADTLADGRPVEPGEFVELSDEDLRERHNEMLVNDGNLIGAEDDVEHQADLADRRVKRRTTASNDEEGEGE